ncbi:MAG: radical SAM protein [Candidatus Eisenbacteria bacterium]
MEQTRAVPLPLFPEARIPEARKPRARRRLSSISPVEETPRARFRPLACSTILNPSRHPQLPFDFSINPYRGCEIGCSYCYARGTHAYLEETGAEGRTPSDPAGFESRIYVKFQAASALAESLRRLSIRGQGIAIGTATDPYQPGEKRFGITRKLLETLATRSGYELSITTKSPLILRDVDLLAQIGSRARLTVQISLITLRRSLSRIVEKHAPSPRRRLETIRGLRSAGIDTGLFVMPILPGITDSDGELGPLLREARSAGAAFASACVLRIPSPAGLVLDPMLEHHFPHLLPQYRRVAAGAGWFPPPLSRAILDRFHRACLACGLPERDDRWQSRANSAAGTRIMPVHETGDLFDPQTAEPAGCVPKR